MPKIYFTHPALLRPLNTPPKPLPPVPDEYLYTVHLRFGGYGIAQFYTLPICYAVDYNTAYECVAAWGQATKNRAAFIKQRVIFGDEIT